MHARCWVHPTFGYWGLQAALGIPNIWPLKFKELDKDQEKDWEQVEANLQKLLQRIKDTSFYFR
jgi:hypothetical protein